MRDMVCRPALSAAVLATALSAIACGEPKPASESVAQQPSPAAVSRGPEAAAGVPAESAGALAALLPDTDSLPGWRRTRAPKRFGPGDLWEHINGAAETVVAFGFQEVVTAGFVRAPDGLEVTADVYRMADDEAAFGLYAQEADPAATVLAIGAEGARRSTALIFWAGPHTVKLTAFEDRPELAPALETLARAIAARIGVAGARPAVFARFPTTGLAARSFRVVPKDALGQSYLPKAYTAGYGPAGREWTLAVIPFDQADAAAAAFDRYREFLGSSGEKPTALAGTGDAAFTGSDGFYGLVVAARRGSALAVALGAPSASAAKAALTAVLGARAP